MRPLSDQLRDIYTARIYPILARNDPLYQRSLAKAGLGWTATEGVPLDHRKSFDEEMKLQAWLAATKIQDANSLEPGTIRAKVIDGSLILYRVSESGGSAPTGIWWFTEKVAQRCREEAGADPKNRLEWLRNTLAVCYNWSRFDRIEHLALHHGESIPAVLGRGLPMPYYKVDPHIDRKTGQRVIEVLPPDYWKKKGEMLLGGELQVVLPWIPVRRVASSDTL